MKLRETKTVINNNNNNKYKALVWAGVPQCLARDWMTGRSRFDPRQRQKEFFSSLCVQTGSGAHRASYSMGTGGPFPGEKRGRGVTLATHPI
jgi:hypothetical protein